MARTDIGRAVPLLKGEYSPTTTYELNDIVSLNGSLYWHYSHEETTNVAPQATSTWKVVLSLADAEAYIARAEFAAESSEDAAEIATAAKTAAESASTTATGASATATTAKNDAVTAKTAAETAQAGAVTAKTAAETARDAAQASATAAGTSATNAGNSAGTAEYYAGIATTAGETASEKATEATGAATTATSAAATATSAKDTAVSSASTASTAATTATSAATAAQAVKDSIPQDYTALSEDVDELKTHLAAISEDIYDTSYLGLSDYTWSPNTGLKYEDGTTTSRNNFTVSEYINVTEGEQITYTLTGQNNLIAVIAAYDDTGVYNRLDSVGYDSGTASSVEHTFSGTYTVPAGVAKIRLGRWLTAGSADDAVSIPTLSPIPAKNAEDIEQIRADISGIEEDLSSIWKNKTISAFGTSITDTGNSPNAIDTNGDPTGKYLPYLISLGKFAELNPLPTVSGIELDHSKSTNFGLAGASINGQILSWIDYYLHNVASHKLGNYANLIIIEGGVNDYAVGIPLGNVGDTTPYTSQYFDYGSNDGTFAGACYQAFTRALTYAEDAVVVYITDSTGKSYSNGNNYYQLRQNSLGLYQRDYAEMAMAVAQFVGIPVIDAGADSMINAQNPDYIVDWIHHTYLGGYQYARTIWAKLKDIQPKATELPT